MIYLDESGVDENIEYEYGWEEIGHRAYAERSGKRGKRINIIGALNHNKLFAPAIFDGYCNTAVFETYLTEYLAPKLKEGQIIILDNATFHKSEKVREIIKSKKCSIKYLPPYSPDLNPIEKKWANIKSNIKKLRRNHDWNLELLITKVVNNEVSGSS